MQVYCSRQVFMLLNQDPLASLGLICRRPRRVCLCAALPDELITLHGKLVILQHPYECR